MGISTQRVKLDINKQASMQVVRLGQGDRNGTTLIAELYDGGGPYSLSGKTARFTMRTPDGRSSYSVNSSSISNNTATFNIDERYAAGVAGTTDVAYIEVLSGSTVICSTSRMGVICLQSATEGVSPSQMHDNGLDAAIAAANAAASSANTAASNANTKASRAETATTSANTARDNANTAASAANAAASAANTAAGSANTAAEAANSAKDAANSAATAANTAADSANAATAEANAAIEAMGDISELAVPEMTASVRGGAKVGGSTQVIGGKLEVKLSESATGTSVTTGSTSALRELQVRGKSIQDGTPTPDAPVPVQVVGSKNLVDFAHPAVVNSDGGVTFTINADGSYDVHGTATKNTYIYVTNNSSGFQLPAGRYTFSARNKDGSYPSTLRIGASKWLNGTNTSLGSASDRALTFDHDGQGNLQLLVYVNNGGTVDATVFPQLEAGSAETPYVPHGSIGIVVGDTATSIDLQGNILASLPDGTRDELHVDSTGHVTITKNTGQVDLGALSWTYASAHNLFHTSAFDEMAFSPSPFIVCSAYKTCSRVPVNLPSANSYLSSGEITHRNTTSGDNYFYIKNSDYTDADLLKASLDGVLAYYKLATSQEIDLGYIDPSAIPSGSVVTISASLTPTFDLSCWTEHASELADIPDAITTLAEVIYDKQESIASSIAPVEGSTASANHAVDDYLMLGARLYRVTTAIASGERIIPGTNVTETTVMAEIVSLLS